MAEAGGAGMVMLVEDDEDLRLATTETLEAEGFTVRAHARAATGSATRVRRIMVLHQEPSFDRGEVTEKGSLNQRAMRSNHAALITDLHASGASGMIRV